MSTPTQPPAAGEAENTPKWRYKINYCDGHDEHPESVALYHDGVQIAHSAADDYALNLFPVIVRACNAHDSDQKRIAALEEALKPFAGIAFEYWPKEPEYFDVSMKRSLIQKARVALATANAQVPRE